MDNLIRYSDLGEEIDKYTNFIVWNGSNEDKINSWLKPIYCYAKDKSEFYGISDERDCGWYIDKNMILNMLCNTVPDTKDNVFKHDLALMLNSLQDFIIDYKEPQRN